MKAIMMAAVAALALLGFTAANAATQTLTLPKGTTVQKLGAGHFRFSLPDGRKVEVRGWSPASGAIIGDCGVYDASGKAVSSGKGGNLRGAGKLTKEQAARLAPRDYVKIDDEVTWLPLTLQFEAKGATRLSPQPDLPGSRKMINPQPEPPKGRLWQLGDPDPPPAR